MLVDGRPNNIAADRVLRVLSAFRTLPGEAGVTDLSVATGLDKSVVHRILSTLAQHQFVQQNSRTRKYEIGLRAWEVGQRYAKHRKLEESAVPLLQALVEECQANGYVGVLDGLEVVYAAVVQSPGPLQVRVAVGSRTQAYATALGKAALAFLPPEELSALLADDTPLERRTENTLASVPLLEQELAAVRRQGFAINRAEHTPGVASIGAAVRDADGYPIGSVSVAFPMLEQFTGLLEELPERLVELAEETARRMGFPTAGPPAKRAPSPQDRVVRGSFSAAP